MQVTASAIVLPDGTVVAAADNGVVHALDPVVGKELWNFTTTGNAAIAGGFAYSSLGSLYFGADAVYQLDVSSGKLQMRYTALHCPSLPLLRGTDWFVSEGCNSCGCCGCDGIHLRDIGPTGQRWTYNIDTSLATVAAGVNGTLYFTATSGVVGGVNPNSGGQVWRQTFGEITSAVAIARDGTVIVG